MSNFKINIKAGTIKKRLRYAPKQRAEKDKTKYNRKQKHKNYES